MQEIPRSNFPASQSSALKLEGLACCWPPSLITSGSSKHIKGKHDDLRSLDAKEDNVGVHAVVLR